MLSFSRTGKQVRAEIDATIPCYQDRILYFYWETGNEIFAGLLTQTLRDQLGEALLKVRREAYESGFKDAKAKRKKQTDFWNGW